MGRRNRHRFGTREKPPGRRALGILLLLLAASGMTALGLAFRSLVTELAVSSARDAVILAVNGIVEEVMAQDEFQASRLVRLDKDASGAVTAVTTDVAAVNTLASRVLERAEERTEEKTVHVDIPLGNLLGSALLLGKGPAIPVQVVMLSSSEAGFRSELTTAGINQTRHQILLELGVDVSLLMPWRTVNSRVETEILVSETVIVGAVPESYMNWTN